MTGQLDSAFAGKNLITENDPGFTVSSWVKLYDLFILRGDMLQLSKRAQHIESIGKEYIPFARKLKSLADTFQERRIDAMIEDALKRVK